MWAAGALGASTFWSVMMALFGLQFDLRGYFDVYANRERATRFSAEKVH
jgi:hypothetical protein